MPEPVAPAGSTAEPTAEEREKHVLTHVPCASWCESCMCGMGRHDKHKRQKREDDGGLENVVQIYYTFLSRGAQQTKVEDEATLVTILTLIDKSSGWPLSIQVPRKGAEKSAYVVDAIQLFLNNLGHDRTILQVDQENSIRTVAWSAQKRMRASKVQVRESPPYSHQSQGKVEGGHAHAESSEHGSWTCKRDTPIA